MSDTKVEETKPQQTQQAQAPQGQEPRRFEKNKTKLRPKRRDDKRGEREKDAFETKIIDIRRVTKMFKGGRRMKISVFVAVGDKKGKVGLGLGKGDDVRSAQDKAVVKAKKNMIFIQLKGNTIPHEVLHKFKSSKVLLKPASPGTGIVAGSSMRLVAEVVGINDVLGKIMGADNKITNAYATVQALALLRPTRI
ncbi:MAG: 30S ribosomal protein S5 [Candidatus Dojkabacteria bacterium]